MRCDRATGESVFQRSQIKYALIGRHEIAPGRVVEVKSARVYPQPAGAFLSYLLTVPGGGTETQDKAGPVIDPGFFSVDSVTLHNNRPYPGAASTSTHAMSRVIEVADGELTRQFGDATTMPGL